MTGQGPRALARVVVPASRRLVASLSLLLLPSSAAGSRLPLLRPPGVCHRPPPPLGGQRASAVAGERPRSPLVPALPASAPPAVVLVPVVAPPWSLLLQLPLLVLLLVVVLVPVEPFALRPPRPGLV